MSNLYNSGNSNYKIGTTYVKPPTKIVPSDNLISRSHDDISGIFRDILIRRKRKVNWVYKAINKEDFLVIYTAVWGQIASTHSRLFNITTEFPGEGFITSVFYLGTPTNFESLMGLFSSGVQFWDLEIHWIEKEGQALRSVTDTEFE